MTSTRKFNTFGGTNINIYLGNKTQKSKLKIPKENRTLIGGAIGIEESKGEEGDEGGDKGKDKTKNVLPLEDEEGSENKGNSENEVLDKVESQPDITSAVANVVAHHADDDAQIDKIETLLTSNWETLYKKLGEIKTDAEYTQKYKTELTQLIQEMVAVALLQTI
jgi:hypothetical protein